MEVILSQISKTITSVQCKSRNMTPVHEVLNDTRLGTSEVSHIVYLSSLKWTGINYITITA